VKVNEAPEGFGTVETYTVVCGRSGAPETGIVIGRLHSGERFLAHTPDDRQLLEYWMKNEAIGIRGRVRAGSPVNTFRPE
jgi:hypothetical protein